jgi:hypothetical protein
MSLETWELLSYVVTVVGLPLAIGVFVYEQRKERENEEEEVYQLLSDNYQDFLKVALAHPDLQLFSLREWGRRRHFRSRLPQLLDGEDLEFVGYLRRLADEEGLRPSVSATT